MTERAQGLWRHVLSTMKAVVVPLGAAFFSGLGVWLFTSDWEATARSKGWFSVAEWQAEARHSQWIPENECPAFPVSVQLTSPGDGATLIATRRGGESRLNTDLVVRSSRPLPENTSVGLVFNESPSSNFYIIFSSFDRTEKRSLFRKETSVVLPFQVTPGQWLNMWAIVVGDSNEYGRDYSSLEQIRAVREDAVVSKRVAVLLKAEAP